MNVILESSAPVQHFASLPATLTAAQISVGYYDWYICDVEVDVPYPDIDLSDRWYTGDEMSAIFMSAPLQFVWGVFSAFPRRPRALRPPVHLVPFVKVNEDYWADAPRLPQLPEAVLEIACWDGCATILSGLTLEQAWAFKSRFPQARLLQQASIWDRYLVDTRKA